MRRAILMAAAAALLVSAAPAAADTAYGGGRLYESGDRLHLFTVSVLRYGAVNQARFRAKVTLTCRGGLAEGDFGGNLVLTGEVGAGRGARTQRQDRGSIRYRWSMEIRFDGSRGYGTLTFHATLRQGGRAYRCVSQRARPFAVAEAPAAVEGPGVALAPNAALAGTAERLYDGELRSPVMIVANRTGRQVGAFWSVLGRCSNSPDWRYMNATPFTRVRSDGSFVRNERYSVRFLGGIVERYRVSFAGRIVAGAATGTLRLRVRAVRRGRTLNRCDSGTQQWRAAAVR